MKIFADQKNIRCLTIILALLFSLPACKAQPTASSGNCRPTPYDELGPFYRPNAPIRSSVGRGYLLEGTVRSAEDCRPLPKTVLEFWLVNEQGQYDDAHRATVIADRQGKYSFESNRPTDYGSRLPHIHIRVTAEAHQELITQHYTGEGQAEATFDPVLQAE
jgi:protocatechuate 3,4-dioxygenase beta subunit